MKSAKIKLKPNCRIWRASKIDEEKKTIRVKLEQIENDQGKKTRLNFTLSQISLLENDETDLGLLRRFIYIISVLVHHEKYGGLREKDIQNLAKLAWGILKVAGVKPVTSRIARLHGELHLILSQIYRKDGKHWLAAWEQQLSSYLSRYTPVGSKNFQNLGHAVRLFRLGQAFSAIYFFQESEKNEKDNSIIELSRLSRIKCLRLTGEIKASAKLADETVGYFSRNFSENAKNELFWESLLRKYNQDKNPKDMILAVSVKSRLFDSTYILETFLWLANHPDRQWLGRFPKIATFARNKELKMTERGFCFEVSRVIEECRNIQVPIEIRLKRLGKYLDQTDKLITIEQELLFWGAAARWLKENHIYALATMCLNEYQGKCLKLSKGKRDDTLGIIKDLDTDQRSVSSTLTR